MGSNQSSAEQNRLLYRAQPNVNQIARSLPDNQELRVKKIYHVNKLEEEEPAPAPPPPPPPAPVVTIVKPVPKPVAVAVKTVPVFQQPVVMQEQPKVVYVQQEKPRVIITPARATSQMKVVQVVQPNTFDYQGGKSIGFDNRPIEMNSFKYVHHIDDVD